MQQLGIQMVFTHLFAFAQHSCRQLHGADVRTRANLRGAAHGVLLAGILEQAHLVQNAAQVALLVRAHRPKAHTGAQAVQPAIHFGFKPAVRGKRVPDHAAVIQQFGRLRIQFGAGERGIHTQHFRCGNRAQAEAVPDFALHIFRGAKQRASGSIGAIARNDQRGVGLLEARQVIEVAVGAE